MNRDELISRIEPKLREGSIQATYTDRSVGLYPAAQTVCQGCDEPITRAAFVGYWSAGGERQWFHVLCDAVRQTVAAQLFMAQVHEWAQESELTAGWRHGQAV